MLDAGLVGNERQKEAECVLWFSTFPSTLSALLWVDFPGKEHFMASPPLLPNE